MSIRLSAEQFAKVVGQLNAMEGVSAQEKRRAPRVARSARLSMVPLANGKPGTPVEVQLINYSSRGICFFSTNALKRGQQFVVRMSRNAGSPISILTAVAHCTALPGGQHRVGAEFVCILPDKSAQFTAPSEAETERIRKSILG